MSNTLTSPRITDVDGVKVGDVFYRSWGYDQTQVNWYVVVDLTPKRIKIQEISGKRIADTRVMPNLESEPFGEIMVKAVQRWNGRACLAFNSYSSCYQWDGTSQYTTGHGMGH